jgi:beta-lactamase regulating signal transducer with metallopeptidase domain
LKIFIVLLPLPVVTLPVLPLPAPVQVTAADVVADRMTGGSRDPQRGPGWEDTDSRRRPAWTSIVVIAWLFVVIAHAFRLFGQHLHVRRVVRRSVPSGDEVGPLASAAGLRRIPAVRSSSDIDAPQVVGVMRPVILMPSVPMAESDRIMALSHELMHVRRGDLALGWVPAIAERLFFFHPLVRLAGREYQTAREAACDAAVVEALGVPAADYGRLLVRFGVTSAQPAVAAGGASRSISSLKRRLAMLQQSSSSGSRRIGWALSAVMLLAMIPIHLVAQAPPRRGVSLQADSKPETAVPIVATPQETRSRVSATVVLAPVSPVVLDSPLESRVTLVAQEPKEPTEKFLRQQLFEVEKALRAAQADEAARTNREKRRQAEVEAIVKSIEEQGSRDQTARETDQRAREVEKAMRESFEQRTRAEYEAVLDAARQKDYAASQQEFTAQQLDGLRHTIEQLANQLEQMRKLERQLREQLKK